MRRITQTLTTTVCLALAALALAMSAAAQPTTTKTRPSWLPDVWWRLAICETRANWRHDSGTYQGAFGIYDGTWDTYRPPGYPSEAHRATPKQQYRVAQRIAANHSMYAWGCYRVIR
ncbi:MAG: transglycosylase family protein [Gaiella sp.]